jgi:hypothetical protein
MNPLDGDIPGAARKSRDTTMGPEARPTAIALTSSIASVTQEWPKALQIAEGDEGPAPRDSSWRSRNHSIVCLRPSSTAIRGSQPSALLA